MRILLTVHQFFPEFTSGTEVLTRSVARELAARGHDVRVLTGFPDERTLEEHERLDEYEIENIHVYRFRHAYTKMLGQSSMIEAGYDNHLAATFFGRIVQDFKPDVVHFFHLNRLGTGLIVSATQEGIPAFMTPTDFWTICPTVQLLLCDGRLCTGPSQHAGNCVKHLAESTLDGVASVLANWLPTPMADLLTRLTKAGLAPQYPHHLEVKAISTRLATNVDRLNRLRKIVAPSHFMCNLLAQHGVSRDRIVHSAFGIDTSGNELKASRRIPSPPLRIGFIGTLAQHKGCHLLIDSFNTLPSGQAILKIYGNTKDFPDYAYRLKQRARHNRAIEFCGIFPNAKISEILHDLDVLVVPSLWYENTPLVVYSAQAARCPIVASDFPGLAEVVRHNVSGLLFKPGSAIALAEQLTRLVHDPVLAARLSNNSPKPKSIGSYVDELLCLWSTA